MTLSRTISDYFSDRGYKVTFRDDDKKKWLNFLNKKEIIKFSTTNYWLDYQKEYLSQELDFQEISFMVNNSNNIDFILPIFYSQKQNKLLLRDNFYELPIFRDGLNANQIKEYSFDVLKFFFNNTKYQKSNSLLKLDEDNEIIKMIEEINPRMNYNYFNEYSVNTCLDFQEIKKQVRKSYKQFSNNKFKDVEIREYDKNIDEKTWLDFKRLHIKVAGRQTRSDKTWNIQYKNLRENSSFFIAAYVNDILAAGAYFEKSISECYYSVSVSDEKYSDFKLMHMILFVSIKKCISLKILKLNLGDEYIASDLNSVDEIKLKNISFFKKGFSTNIDKKIGVIF